MSTPKYSLYECEDYDGYRMPKHFDVVKEKIENFEVRDDDVWVSSYPKSGSNWLQEMVWLIGTDFDYEKAKVPLASRCLLIENEGLGDCFSTFCKENGLRDCLGDLTKSDVVQTLSKVEGRRFIKTHLPWHLLPKQIKDGTKTPKVFHIMRNPKEVVPSYYHHSANLFPLYKGDLENFAQLFVEGRLLFGDYFNTVLSYWKQRDRPNVMVVVYEDMHADVKGTIRKVAEFLGKKVSDEQIEKLAKHLSFDEMKKNPAVNYEMVLKDSSRQFLRKGKTDGHKGELTKGMIDKLDEWIEKKTKGTGLPYERKC